MHITPNPKKNCLRLEIDGEFSRRMIIRRWLNGESIDAFKSLISSKRLPKIYVVVSHGLFYYVGYTHQSMTTRLRQGFKPKGKDYGYQWRGFPEVEIYVFTFGDVGFEDKVPREVHDFYEAVEAELAYLNRFKTNRWPECQNEIHFNNGNIEGATKLAQEIFDDVQNPLLNTTIVP